VITSGEDDCICLTDIAKTREGESRAADIIKNWIRSRSTLEFLGTWEQLYNPGFKVVKFDHFKMNAGLPGFVLKLLNYYYYRPMLAAFLPALQPYKYFVYCIQTLCMETKQAAR